MNKTVERVPLVKASQFKRTRVAAYARVSSGKDAMRHSLAAQVSYYSDLIRNNPRWEYCGVYADEALTGTKTDRDGFQRLLKECRSGNIDMVITKSVSRLSRNTVTFLETVRELRNLGIDVYFEEQNTHTMSAEGELLLTLIASFAQAESFSASENQKWRIRKGFENGELLEMRHMLGYNICRGKITVNEEQAKIVREIFRKAFNGESLEAISRWLKDHNIRGIFGGTIKGSGVHAILSNEKYTGNALLQKSFVNNHLEKRQVKNNGEITQYFVANTHEAIIDAETFEAVQDRLRDMREAVVHKGPYTHTVFKSRIRCAKCGANFIRAYNRKPVWMCVTYKKQGRGFCDAKQIPENILKRLSCEVLDLAEFDENVFRERVEYITADSGADGNTLAFTLADGKVIVKRWQNPSRSESWTPEMKAAASEAGKRGHHNGKK